MIDRDRPSPLLSREATTTRCRDPFRLGNHQPSIDALSELDSGRVAEGREGQRTTQLESTANPVPTLKGSGHPSFCRPSIDALPKISDLGEGAPTGREGEIVLGWALAQSSAFTTHFEPACGPRILCEDSEDPHPAFGHPPPTGVGGGRDLRVDSFNSHPDQPELLPQRGCPGSRQTRARHHILSIHALSELVSGRVAEGREGPNTSQLSSTANPVPTLRGSGAESRAKREVTC